MGSPQVRAAAPGIAYVLWKKKIKTILASLALLAALSAQTRGYLEALRMGGGVVDAGRQPWLTVPTTMVDNHG